jgi:alkylation response protein AidB-like acyl-CoA dehydrogenase
MTTIDLSPTTDLVARATTVGRTIEANSSRHDLDGTFVTEAYELLRSEGLLAMAVPVELGGGGATLREIASVQRELARYCGSTALASSMHQHVTAFTTWRYRRGLPGAETTLRRVVDEGIVLVSTGGADLTHPRGQATKVDGGYRVSGHKVFASQSVAGTVLSTMFTYDDPDQGRRVLNMSVPIASDGIHVLDNWDTLGMRGTGSNDVILEDVFVPDERVLADRPYGVIDPALQVILSIALPIISAVYLGVADAAHRATIEALSGRSTDAVVHRQIGLMDHRLRIASWALDRALDEVGDDPEPSVDRLVAVLGAKREIALAGIEVCDLAMDVVGGTAFYRGSTIERTYRDIRAAKFHPLTPESTLVHAGRHALGLSVDEIG